MISVSFEIVSFLARLAFQLSRLSTLLRLKVHCLALWVAEVSKPSLLPASPDALEDWSDVLVLFDVIVVFVIFAGLLFAFLCGARCAQARCAAGPERLPDQATVLGAQRAQADLRVRPLQRRALTPVQLLSPSPARLVRRQTSRPLRRSFTDPPTPEPKLAAQSPLGNFPVPLRGGMSAPSASGALGLPSATSIQLALS